MRFPIQDKTFWHKRFALLPITIGNCRVWLENFEQRKVYCQIARKPVTYWEKRLCSRS